LTLPRARWVLWLALWLALFGALAPTVSHAVQWARGGASAGLIEICTSSGPRWMALAASPAWGEAGPAGQAGTAGDATALTTSVFESPNQDGSGLPAVLAHCPFCLLMAERAAPPSAVTPLFIAAPGQAVRPLSHPASFSPAHSLAAAQPRGPPAL